MSFDFDALSARQDAVLARHSGTTPPPDVDPPTLTAEDTDGTDPTAAKMAPISGSSPFRLTRAVLGPERHGGDFQATLKHTTTPETATRRPSPRAGGGETRRRSGPLPHGWGRERPEPGRRYTPLTPLRMLRSWYDQAAKSLAHNLGEGANSEKEEEVNPEDEVTSKMLTEAEGAFLHAPLAGEDGSTEVRARGPLKLWP